MDNLDLTFFATGEAQHVFFKTGENKDWVYKIPAAFGYVLPFNYSVGNYVFPWFRPKNLFQRFLRFIFIKISRHVCQKTLAKQGLISSESDNRFSAKILKKVRQIALIYKDFGEIIIAFFHKIESLKNFKEMMRVLDYLGEQPVSDVILPYKIIRSCKATLRVDDKIIDYKGPIIIQKKADFVFTDHRSYSFHTFEWNRLVDLQQQLWKYGTAFISTGEIMGPKNWALLKGKIYLCDTSSITQDFDKGLKALRNENLDKKEQSILHMLERASSFQTVEEASKFYQFVRKEINQDRFIRLWNTGHRR